jgi:hypothetical protein
MTPKHDTDLVLAAMTAEAAVQAMGVPPRLVQTQPQAQAPQAPWGASMREVAPVRHVRVRPDTESGWGRSQTIFPTGRAMELARVELEVSEPLTLSVDVTENPAAGLGFPKPIPMTVWALVTFGNGSTSVTRKIRCDYRFDVPVVGTYVSVSVYIGDLAGTPFPNNIVFTNTPQAQVSVQVARGVRGLPYVCSQFLIDDGNALGVLFQGAARGLSIEAHLTGPVAGPLFLQLFDSPTQPNSGDVGVVEYPIGATPFLGVPLTRWLNPRGFATGVAYGVSSTSGLFTATADAVHIEFEQLLL